MSYLLVLLVMFICALVQTVVGFAFSLMAIPVLLLLGYDLPLAVMTSMTASATQRLIMVIRYHRQLDWPTLFGMYPWAIVGLMIGICLLKQVANLNSQVIRQLFGIIIMFVVGLQCLARVKPRQHVPAWCGWVSAFFSGIFNGFANIGGPPLVFWVLANPWGKDRLRVTMPAFTLMMVPVQMILFFTTFGRDMGKGIARGLLAAPMILLAVYLGNKISAKISVSKLRLAIMLLLVITGLHYALAPLLGK